MPPETSAARAGVLDAEVLGAPTRGESRSGVGLLRALDELLLGPWGVALVALAAAAAALLPMPHAHVVDGHEALEGLRIREMLREGQWFFADRPPLFYWVGATLAWLRGGVVDEVTLRLPSAIAAISCVVAVVALGRHLVGPRVAVLAGLVLVTTPSFAQPAYSGRIDMVLCALTATALLLWRRGAGFGFGCAAGLACLAKGPLGLVLIGFVAFANAIAEGSPRRLLELCRPRVWLPVAATGGAYYGFGALRAGFWDDQVVSANVSRFFGAHGAMPSLYYVEHALDDATLWTFLFPFALWWALRQRGSGAFFAATWWLAVTLFFQLSAYKRSRYLLPAQPAAALVVAAWLHACVGGWLRAASPDTRARAATALGALLSIAVVVGGAAWVYASEAVVAELSGPRIAAAGEVFRSLVRAHAPVAIAISLVAMGCGALQVDAFRRGAAGQLVVATVGLLWIVYALLNPAWRWAASNVDSPRAWAAELRAASPASGPIQWAGPREPKVFPTLFYLEAEAPLAIAEAPAGPGVYVMNSRLAAVLTGPQWRRHAYDADQPVALVELRGDR